MKYLIAFLLALVVTIAGADTTSNLITGTGYTGQSRTGAINGANPRDLLGCCTGSGAYVDTSNGGAIYFSYNQTTVSQTKAINQALQGSGVQVGGYNYSWEYYNQDSNRGTLTSTIKMTNSGGSTIHSYSPTMGSTTNGWTPLSGTKTFSSPYDLPTLGNISVSFTGRDDRGWAGYYGPAVRNVDLRLNYTVDPCVANPAYSPTCANYNTVQTSDPILSDVVGRSYAINQALGLSGGGVMIHAFNYGYDYSVGGQYCSGWNPFNICFGWSDSDATLTANMSASNGTSLYSNSHTHSGQNISGSPSYRYLFPASRNLSTLGNVDFSVTTHGIASISNVWSTFEYTPDPCTVNPLSSTSCAGYAQAYQNQRCTANPLYATTCPGYAAAYLTQQCTANPLYNASCPGYAAALFTQQCSANPLSDNTCPGYAVAYHDQQCGINPLYMSDCNGYAAAYKTQQCTSNPLYATDCPGYAVAYHDQQCGISPLFMSDCPGYAVAYKSQQCSLSALYASDCPGYATAYFNQQCSASALYNSQCPGYAAAYKTQQCSANTLYSSDCPGYAVAYKNQQCTANALYASDCPGYAVAYHDSQCAANPLYMSDCPGYAVAYKSQQCGISALYATDCPGYASAYKSQQCSLNSLYSADCPGYAAAYLTQQCNLNGLYDRSCPNYGAAYATKQLLDTPKTTTSLVTTVSSPIATTTSDTVSSPTSVAISDPVVKSSVSTPASTSPTSPTSVVGPLSIINPPKAPAVETAIATVSINPPVPAEKQQEKQQETKKTEGQVARAVATAKGGVAAAAKDAAAKSANAKTMEEQAATQGVVVGLMGYVPGFTAYQNALVPDVLANAVARQYMKPNVDNRNVQRRLTGASDAKWQEMVDSQYKLGN
jgi:hypothetical protein